MEKTNFKSALITLAAGGLFGAGLSLSGMTDSDKVQGFLDLFGNWDISLMFVMIGAIGIGFLAFNLVQKRDKPILADTFQLPTCTGIDKRLVTGAFLFGIGWGLVGYCPGPAIASLAYGYWQAGVFVISMLIGATVNKKLFS